MRRSISPLFSQLNFVAASSGKFQCDLNIFRLTHPPLGKPKLQGMSKKTLQLHRDTQAHQNCCRLGPFGWPCEPLAKRYNQKLETPINQFWLRHRIDGGAVPLLPQISLCFRCAWFLVTFFSYIFLPSRLSRPRISVRLTEYLSPIARPADTLEVTSHLHEKSEARNSLS